MISPVEFRVPGFGFIFTMCIEVKHIVVKDVHFLSIFVVVPSSLAQQAHSAKGDLAFMVGAVARISPYKPLLSTSGLWFYSALLNYEFISLCVCVSPES